MIHVWECFDLVVLDSPLFPILLIFVFHSSKHDVCSPISGKNSSFDSIQTHGDYAFYVVFIIISV